VVSIDVADARLEAARKFGADTVVNTKYQCARTIIDQL
jgi:alcohol dehydrogenase